MSLRTLPALLLPLLLTWCCALASPQQPSKELARMLARAVQTAAKQRQLQPTGRSLAQAGGTCSGSGTVRVKMPFVKLGLFDFIPDIGGDGDTGNVTDGVDYCTAADMAYLECAQEIAMSLKASSQINPQTNEPICVLGGEPTFPAAAAGKCPAATGNEQLGMEFAGVLGGFLGEEEGEMPAPGIVQLAIPFGNPEPKWAYAVLLTANGTGLAMAVDVGFMSQPGIDPEDPAVWMQLKLCLGEAQLVGGSLAGIDPVPGAAAPSPSPSPAPTSGAGSRTAGSAATMAASALAALLLLLALAC